MISHLESDILECKVKWALGSITLFITVNKASGGDGIPVELFQILQDDAVKVLHSTCQQIWKTQQWPQSRKRSVFILIPKKSESESRSVMSDSLQPHGLYSLCNSPDQNTEVGSLFLLQGIFPTQGLNPGLPIPKKGNAKECSNYRTVALISHVSKVMLKILQARLQ